METVSGTVLALGLPWSSALDRSHRLRGFHEKANHGHFEYFGYSLEREQGQVLT